MSIAKKTDELSEQLKQLSIIVGKMANIMTVNALKERDNSMSKDTFQPQNSFEGYVYAKLENIEKRFEDLPCKESFTRLNKVENQLSNIEGRATVFGVVAGFVAGLFSKWWVK